MAHKARIIQLKELGEERWPWTLRGPVFVEHRDQKQGLWAFMMTQTKTNLDLQFEPLIGIGNYKKREYNKTWRMWTGEPTDKQKQEEPWQ